MNLNPTLLTDAYKLDHRHQYPKETTLVYSNMTPRKSRIPGVDKVVFFGLQAYIYETLIQRWNRDFFQKPIDSITKEFTRKMTAFTLSKDFAEAIGVDHWIALHKLGYLPLHIKALEEGTLCPMRVPFLTVKNTHPEFYWLTNYIETDMSSELWGMITSATIAASYKGIFTKWAKKTGGSLDFVEFQGHDFSYRGMFGREAAMKSGAAHLLSFKGTDTIPAVDYLEHYYDADIEKDIVGCSVFATEHAVMCVTTGFYIKKNGLDWEHYGEAEFEVFKRLITEVYPTGIISIVSDTWDLWKVLTDYLPRLKKEILARSGKVVIRPDSGVPEDILCGRTFFEGSLEDVWNSDEGIELIKIDDKYFEVELDTVDEHTGTVTPKQGKEVATPAVKGVIQLLWETFGGTVNEKGYKELDPHIGAIYGDSITTERAYEICARLATKDFASTNWVAGIGSYTYQHVTRDTFGIAMKATYAEVEIEGKTEGIEIFKDPITDDGTKKSAKGLLHVWQRRHGELVLNDQVNWHDEAHGLLQTVFFNGELTRETTLSEIRDRLVIKD